MSVNPGFLYSPYPNYMQNRTPKESYYWFFHYKVLGNSGFSLSITLRSFVVDPSDLNKVTFFTFNAESNIGVF